MDYELHETLRRARWLPADSLPWQSLSRHNLLDDVAAQWKAADAASGSDRKWRREFASWVAKQRQRGAVLTVDRPEIRGPRRAVERAWLGRRLCWWPQGIPAGKWIAVVSSRLGRRLEQRPEWFESFRDICRLIQSQQAVLFSGHCTTTGRFTAPAAKRFGLDSLVVHVADNCETAETWLRKIYKSKNLEEPVNPANVFVSPVICAKGPVDDTLNELPLVDRVVVAWADDLFVPYLRRGGNLDRLIRDRLANVDSLKREVFLRTGPRHVSSELAQELKELGAAEWPVTATGRESIAGPIRETRDVPSVSAATVEGSSADPMIFGGAWSYLSHCTRGPIGPWPDQNEDEYLDELIAGKCGERSSFDALIRILDQQRIHASGTALRGGRPAVCFTSVPLAELNSLRAYQPQRQCWSFEPFGICIDRNWLIERGARPVIYGDDDVWRSLSAVDRPFFQRSTTSRLTRRRDWTFEREWRHLGDLELTTIPDDKAVVFVSEEAEVAKIKFCSRWPVISLAAVAREASAAV